MSLFRHINAHEKFLGSVCECKFCEALNHPWRKHIALVTQKLAGADGGQFAFKQSLLCPHWIQGIVKAHQTCQISWSRRSHFVVCKWREKPSIYGYSYALTPRNTYAYYWQKGKCPETVIPKGIFEPNPHSMSPAHFHRCLERNSMSQRKNSQKPWRTDLPNQPIRLFQQGQWFKRATPAQFYDTPTTYIKNFTLLQASKACIPHWPRSGRITRSQRFISEDWQGSQKTPKWDPTPSTQGYLDPKKKLQPCPAETRQGSPANYHPEKKAKPMPNSLPQSENSCHFWSNTQGPKGKSLNPTQKLEIQNYEHNAKIFRSKPKG